MNKYLLTAIVLATGAVMLAACSKHRAVANRNMTPAQVSALQAASARRGAAMSAAPGTVAAAQSGSRAANAATANLPNLAYIAHLYPLNGNATGRQTSGKAQFAIDGDRLTIRVNVENAPPGIAHWQHLHGFVNGNSAKCANDTSDVNGDGIVDLIETEVVSGTTLVPLNGDPAAMRIASDSYPKAVADGSYVYQKTVSLKALESAFAKAYNGQKLDLAKRVIYVHGVLPGTRLPASVTSLKGVPAQVTLPIACGEITAVPQTMAVPASAAMPQS